MVASSRSLVCASDQPSRALATPIFSNDAGDVVVGCCCWVALLWRLHKRVLDVHCQHVKVHCPGRGHPCAATWGIRTFSVGHTTVGVDRCGRWDDDLSSSYSPSCRNSLSGTCASLLHSKSSSSSRNEDSGAERQIPMAGTVRLFVITAAP